MVFEWFRHRKLSPECQLVEAASVRAPGGHAAQSRVSLINIHELMGTRRLANNFDYCVGSAVAQSLLRRNAQEWSRV